MGNMIKKPFIEPPNRSLQKPFPFKLIALATAVEDEDGDVVVDANVGLNAQEMRVEFVKRNLPDILNSVPLPVGIFS